MVRRLIDKDRVREQRRQARLLVIMEKKFAPAFRKEINRTYAELVVGFKATGSVPNLSEEHAANLTTLYKRLSLVTFEIFGGRVLDQGKSIQLVVAPLLRMEAKQFEDFFQRVALEYVAGEAIRQRITSVSTSTRANIISLVTLGQEEGLGVDVIARSMARTLPSISRQRAVLIARTETHGAANVGADRAARELGLELNKEWTAAFDERTRPAHAEADGQVVAMDQPFIVGGEQLMFAGDPNGSAENTINCRCAVSHIVVE